MRDEEADVFLKYFGEEIRGRMIIENLEYPYFHEKNILVVAEGVEQKEEFEYLAGIGVDLFQGFYLAEPA